jgi:hypothetical protein
MKWGAIVLEGAGLGKHCAELISGSFMASLLRAFITGLAATQKAD